MRPDKEWPVVVVGAGPNGLTTANLLARYGVDVLLIERNETTVQEPRAVSIDDESLRTMQAIGVVDTVVSRVVLGYGSDYFSAGGSCFLRVRPTTEGIRLSATECVSPADIRATVAGLFLHARGPRNYV